jgi:recombination protein RecA
MNQVLQKLSGSLSRLRTMTIFIHQLREKIEVMFDSPETTPGGMEQGRMLGPTSLATLHFL